MSHRKKKVEGNLRCLPIKTVCRYPADLLGKEVPRYRWGKLVDSEPSRFIEEINDEYLEYLNNCLEVNIII